MRSAHFVLSILMAMMAFFLFVYPHLHTLYFINIHAIKDKFSLVSIYFGSFSLFTSKFYAYLDEHVWDHSCYNLNRWANDRASSVNTHNDCFILSEHANCQGDSMRVAPGENCHSDFRDCSFNDVTSSFKRC